jgi:outer membrane protein TolC
MVTWKTLTTSRLLAGMACFGILAGCQAVHELADAMDNPVGSRLAWSRPAVVESQATSERQPPFDSVPGVEVESPIQRVAHGQPVKSPESAAAAPAMPPASDVQNWPIDLPTALRLANASNLDVALARERINASYARVEGAEALWLPNLNAGTAYQLHEGTIQRAAGDILDVRRSSLFVGGGPTLAVDVADAIFEPLVTQQLHCADSFAAEATTHNTLLRVAEDYLNLLAAYSSREIAEETLKNADELSRLTNEFVRQEVGLKSDAARALTERGIREQQVQLTEETILLASVSLSQLLRLDAQVQLTPVETKVVPLVFVDVGQPLPELVAQGVQNRPELAEQRHLVQASVEQLQQAQYGPLIPSVLLGYQGGGFGGGTGTHFGDFQDRNDFTAAAVWELRNFGIGDRVNQRVRESQLRQSQLRWMQVADRVAAEIVAAHRVVQTRRRQLTVSERTVESARKSFDLNMTRIRGGAGLPIEVLQSLQALDRARQDYLATVISFSKAQFRLLNAIGNVPPQTDALSEN